MNKPVALKFYDPLKANDTYRQDCFLREADILEMFAGQPDIILLTQGLTHIQLPVVAGSQSLPIPLMFLATEYAEQDLDIFIHSGRATLSEKLLHFRACCRAIQRLHNRGVAHRDLKPGNFLLVGGKVKLGDFGTARNYAALTPALLKAYRSPQDVKYRGTPAYTAPELLLGAESRPYAFYGGDMYSLGAILFEFLTEQSLGDHVINRRLMRNLYLASLSVPDELLEAWTTANVAILAKSQPLPNLTFIDKDIPKNVQSRLNRLYHGLAALNYRARFRRFDPIFQTLEYCLRVLG